MISTIKKDKKLKRFTKQQLVNRVKIANKDIEKGNFISQRDVEKLSNKW